MLFVILCFVSCECIFMAFAICLICICIIYIDILFEMYHKIMVFDIFGHIYICMMFSKCMCLICIIKLSYLGHGFLID